MLVRGNLSNTLQRYDCRPVSMPSQNGELAGERQQVRQEVARAVHQLDRGLAILHADVDVQSEDQVGARHHLQVLHDGLVAVVGVDLLLAPVREGMGAAGRQAQAVLPRQRDDLRGGFFTSSLASLMFAQTPCRSRPPTGASPASPVPPGAACPSARSRRGCANEDRASPDRPSGTPLRSRW